MEQKRNEDSRRMRAQAVVGDPEHKISPATLANRIDPPTISAMRMLLPRFPIVLSVVVLVGLLTGQDVLRDFVLCQGQDGHVAVEPATGPGRSCETLSALQAQHRSAAWLSGARDMELHCGGCKDTALAQTSVVYSEPTGLRHLAVSPELHLLWLPSTIRPALTDDRVKPLNLARSMGSSLPNPDILRSTILLI